MLTDNEKVRIRYHLGYLNATAQSTFAIGTPAGVQTQFMIESAFTKVLPEAEYLVRQLIERLDAIDLQLFENTENVAVTQVDEIALRPDEMKQILMRYDHFRRALAGIMGCEPNPWDIRFQGGMNSMNIPVLS